MTFQTSRRNQPAEVHLAIDVSRTICPPTALNQKRHRQLKQEAVFPVEIRLPFPARPDHQIDLLRSRRDASLRRLICGLIERDFILIYTPLHFEVRTFRSSANNILAVYKTSFDGMCIRRARGPEMRSFHETIDNVLVARPARCYLMGIGVASCWPGDLRLGSYPRPARKKEKEYYAGSS